MSFRSESLRGDGRAGRAVNGDQVSVAEAAGRVARGDHCGDAVLAGDERGVGHWAPGVSDHRGNAGPGNQATPSPPRMLTFVLDGKAPIPVPPAPAPGAPSVQPAGGAPPVDN